VKAAEEATLFFLAQALRSTLVWARAPLRANWLETPSMRCVELMFLTRTIW
jgi:hypothetical protein